MAMDWSQDEMTALLTKVLELVGNKPSSFPSLKAKVKWGELGMDRTAEECENMFNSLTAKVRKFRLFSEIIDEAKEDVKKGCTVKFCQANFPDFPKKPGGAINLYMKDHQSEFEGVHGKDVFVLLAQKWRDCPEAEKEKYKHKNNKKMKKYQEKLEKFQKNHPNVVLMKKGNSQTKAKAPTLPVAPRPVNLYTEHHLPQMQSKHPDLTIKDLRNKCASKYKKLKDKKKLKWIIQAQELLPEYKAQLEAHQEQHPSAKQKVPAPIFSKEEKSLLDKHEGKPVAPPTNMFQYFRQQQDISPTLSIAERSAHCSSLYQKLSQEDRGKLEADYKEIVKKYITEYTNFYESLSESKKEAEMATFKGLSTFQKIVERTRGKRKASQDSDSASPAKKAKSKDSVPNHTAPSSPKKKSKKSKVLFSEPLSDSDEKNKLPGKTAKPDISDSSSAEEIESLQARQKKVHKKGVAEKPPVAVSPKKSLPPSNSHDDSDDFEDGMLSFSSPSSAQKASPKSKKPKDEVENSKPEPAADVDDDLLSFFSPLRSSGDTDSGPSKPKKSPKKKSKRKLM